MDRRQLITGLISLAVTAPAIVRATSIMPVRVIRPTLIKTNWTIIAQVSGEPYNGSYFTSIRNEFFGDDSYGLVVTPIKERINIGDTVYVDDSGRAYA